MEIHHVNSIYMKELRFRHVNMLRLVYKDVLQTRHVDRVYMVLLCHFHTYIYTAVCLLSARCLLAVSSSCPLIV